MPEYTVQQGDYLSKIAKQHGIADYRTLWNHPKNKKLKELRVNPNVLYPGDVVFVPETETKKESRSTDKKWTFETSLKVPKLRIAVLDLTGKAVGGTSCELKVTGAEDIASQKTDANGMVERPIPADAENGQLKLIDDKVPIDLDTELLIGHLDPIDTVSGWQARLNNLGYNAGEVSGEANPQLTSAIEEFQCDHKLTVDGICGSKTQAKLKEVHGC
jgi:hypothetical protein